MRACRLVQWLLLSLFAVACSAGEAKGGLAEGFTGLTGSNFRQKAAAVEIIAHSGDPRATPVLQALLDGRLFMRRDDKRVVIVDDTSLTDAASGDALGPVDKGALRKVAINNQMRVALRAALARLSLGDPDPAARLAAVQALDRKSVV